MILRFQTPFIQTIDVEIDEYGISIAIFQRVVNGRKNQAINQEVLGIFIGKN